MLPINYESWHHMPDSNKNQALDNIKERFALDVSDDYIKKALGKKWRDHKSTLKKQYFKKDISLEEKLRNVPPGMLRYQWEDAVGFWNSKKGEDRERVGTSSRQKLKFTHTIRSRSFASVAEAKKKLKEKKAEYEAIASTDSSVNLENIDNRIITEVLGPKSSQQYMPSGSQDQAEVQRLKDQIAQMQASTVEQIAEVERKYEELQQQLRTDAAARETAATAREVAAAAMAVE
ncbi:ATP-dependent helicase/nuclease subunit A [Gossypium arboreum]|uniref:ATP-dependent helicase/nuclease subunit A n=1 Tax=Gossypium arboreum TaxID=29729 RepID=A0A0B0NVM9_GOSAR|nr:ATP-dependent helicase/nuclease subunit A [Gossypium arboreum]